MSKSKKNVVDPDVIVERYGADTVRLFCLSDSPPERDLEWSDQNVEGCQRFLNRVWSLVSELLPELCGVDAYSGGLPEHGPSRELLQTVHATIKKVSEEIEERYHLNTAISAIRILANSIQNIGFEKGGDSERSIVRLAVETLLVLLYPFVPHLCEELWEQAGHTTGLLDHPWPQWNEKMLVQEEVRIAVQVNGKVRGQVDVPAGTSQDSALEKALSDPRVQRYTEGKELHKVIYVTDRLLSLVVQSRQNQ